MKVKDKDSREEEEHQEVTVLGLPKKGYFARMRVYQKERFPIAVRYTSSVFLCLSFMSFLEIIQGIKLSIFSSYTLLGIWSMFSIKFILKLMDELSDKEIDKKLYPHRTFPSGKVLESDLKFTLVTLIILYLGLNIVFFQTLWMALGLLTYGLSMARYFFIPSTRKFFFFNFATHSLIIPLLFFYLLILFSAKHGLKMKDLNQPFVLLLIGMYWAMLFAWEITRKIRSREEETAYVTYSRVFGLIGAVLVAVGFKTIALSIGLYFFWAFLFSKIYLFILLAGYAAAIWGHIRFVRNPNPVTSKLLPFSERFIISVVSAQIVNYILLVV